MGARFVSVALLFLTVAQWRIMPTQSRQLFQAPVAQIPLFPVTLTASTWRSGDSNFEGFGVPRGTDFPRRALLQDGSDSEPTDVRDTGPSGTNISTAPTPIATTTTTTPVVQDLEHESDDDPFGFGDVRVSNRNRGDDDDDYYDYDVEPCENTTACPEVDEIRPIFFRACNGANDRRCCQELEDAGARVLCSRCYVLMCREFSPFGGEIYLNECFQFRSCNDP